MAEIATVGQDLEGRILGAVHRSNTVTVEAMKVLTDAMQPVVAVIPSVTPPLAYDFIEKLIVSQRKFAEDMLHVTAKLTPTK
ncbi:MAG TPA: hypothetical protein VMI33_13240 [Streptosporangiaceae bacterium]|nr:hypothetical protein [Streptosporangiaceae bacterium]